MVRGFLNGSLKFNLFRLKEPFDAIANGLVFSGCLLGICGSLKWVGVAMVRCQLFIKFIKQGMAGLPRQDVGEPPTLHWIGFQAALCG